MFRSEYADVPPVELPIHDAVLVRAAEFGDIPALIDGTDGTTLSYEQCRGYDKALRRSAPERHVVRHPTASTSPGGEGVMQVTERVASYKWIRHVTFIDGVPRAASGKVLRRQLRERA
ncbi:hypothetical protein ABZ830_15785 [Streptomyces coeruleorubidus]